MPGVPTETESACLTASKRARNLEDVKSHSAESIQVLMFALHLPCIQHFSTMRSRDTGMTEEEDHHLKWEKGKEGKSGSIPKLLAC